MQNIFKKTLLAAATATLLAGTAYAGGHEEKVGVILGFTGPIESLTPTMADSAELAFTEASNSGLLLDGKVLVAVRADSTCVDSAAATAACIHCIPLEHSGPLRAQRQAVARRRSSC